MDVAFVDSDTVVGCLLRDHRGVILRAWTSHYLSLNVFCAEMEVVVQAFELAGENGLDSVVFESDALGVVFALVRLDDYVDWQAKRTVVKGRSVLARHPL